MSSAGIESDNGVAVLIRSDGILCLVTVPVRTVFRRLRHSDNRFFDALNKLFFKSPDPDKMVLYLVFLKLKFRLVT